MLTAIDFDVLWDSVAAAGRALRREEVMCKVVGSHWDLYDPRCDQAVGLPMTLGGMSRLVVANCWRPKGHKGAHDWDGLFGDYPFARWFVADSYSHRHDGCLGPDFQRTHSRQEEA